MSDRVDDGGARVRVLDRALDRVLDRAVCVCVCVTYVWVVRQELAERHVGGGGPGSFRTDVKAGPSCHGVGDGAAQRVSSRRGDAVLIDPEQGRDVLVLGFEEPRFAFEKIRQHRRAVHHARRRRRRLEETGTGTAAWLLLDPQRRSTGLGVRVQVQVQVSGFRFSGFQVSGFRFQVRVRVQIRVRGSSSSSGAG
jgi:hypothetical protein